MHQRIFTAWPMRRRSPCKSAFPQLGKISQKKANSDPYSRAVRAPTACLQAVSCIVPCAMAFAMVRIHNLHFKWKLSCAMAFAMVREAGRFASGKAQAPRPRSAPHTLGTAGLSLQRSSPALFCRRRRRIVQRHTRPHELAYPCSKTSLALLRRLPCCQFRRWRWRCRL